MSDEEVSAEQRYAEDAAFHDLVQATLHVVADGNVNREDARQAFLVIERIKRAGQVADPFQVEER